MLGKRDAPMLTMQVPEIGKTNLTFSEPWSEGSVRQNAPLPSLGGIRESITERGGFGQGEANLY